ncbi:MAG: cytochrome o ubiquinol oxidase subunit III [Candidatus Dormibacteria bacterium]
MTIATAGQQVRNEKETTAAIGFWIYILTDCVLFAALFATFAVLRRNTSLGPPIVQVFQPPYVLAETLVLLFSSFTCALGMQALTAKAQQRGLIWFGVTFALGFLFIGMETYDLAKLVAGGDSWSRSGALSAYFTLVGTHGFHLVAGLTWLAVLVVRTIRRGLTPAETRRFTLFTTYWHFLDIIWIFIFSIVYLAVVAVP